MIEDLEAVVAEMTTLLDENEEGGEEAATEETVEENSKKIEELQERATKIRSEIDRQQRFTQNLAALKAEFPRSAPKEERAKSVHTMTTEVAAVEEKREAAILPHYAQAKNHHSLRAFKGPDAERDAYRSGMWLRGYLFNDRACRQWCVDNNVMSRADCNLPAQAGRVQGVDQEDPSLGGATVNDEMSSTIIRLVEEYGVYPQHANRAPMNSDVLILPRRTGGLTAQAVNENCAADPSQITFDQVKLIAGMWAVQNRVPMSLLEDSVINLADLIATECGYGFAQAVDNAGFNGDGSAPVNFTTGVCVEILKAEHAGSVVTATGTDFPSLTMEDFTTQMALLPDYAMAGAAWYISPSGYGQSMAPLAIAAGGNTVGHIADGPSRASFLGFPVHMVNAMASGAGDHGGEVACLFGNFAQACTYGDRRAVTIKTSTERFIEYDQLLTVGTCRNAMVAHELGTDTDPGSLIALKFGTI